MSAGPDHRARELFASALDVPPARRRAFLNAQCGSDAELLAEVESLLDYDRVAGAFMAAAPGLDESHAPLPAGRRIGVYEIRRAVGGGGMGVVYEAVQDQPHRTVALKVLRRGVASRRALKRFRHEVEILGRLQHPGIAQIHDAGTFDDGEGARPYFAMELIRGRPLIERANTNGLSVRARLALFAKVCDAVQYAHRKGVIHRDLKPDNILVDEQDEVKILDFGVARATDHDIQTTTLETGIGQLIGTVPYMSPEQVAGDPHELDTRSDVYSLGVVLYELLADRLPHDLSDRSIPEAVRIIREDDPTPLSSVSRSFRGDLETIVAKALEKDRERRYQSAADLGTDLHHYLNDEPIVARPASTLYQVRKFAGRNKRLVAAVVAAFVLLLAGTLVSTALYLRAEARAEALRRRSYFNTIALAQGAYEQANTLELVQLLDACPADLRAWEWHYLKRLSDTSLMTLPGHADGVGDAAFSPDGTLIASSGRDDILKLWSAETGVLLEEFPGHAGWSGFVAFSPDGSRLLATGGETGFEGLVWDTNTGRLLHTLAGHPGYVMTGGFSPDGRLVATGGGERDHSVRLWDGASGEPIRTLDGHEDAIDCLAWSPDGRRVVSGSWDNTVKWWDVESGQAIMSRAHDDRVIAVAFSPDGTLVASGGWDRSVRLWEAESGELLRTFRRGSDTVEAVAFSPDSRRIAAATGLGIAVWDVETGEEEAPRLGHLNVVQSVAFSPDGSTIASGSKDGRIRLWDAAPNEEPVALRGHTDDVTGIAVFPDGRRVVSVARDGTIRVWDARSRTEQMVLPPGHRGRILAVAVNADGGMIASGGEDGTVRVWDATSGSPLRTIEGHKHPVSGVAFSPPQSERATVASSSWDGTTKIWDARDGAPIRTLLSDDRRWKVAFSPDGGRIASCGDGDLSVWDVATGERVYTLAGDDVFKQVAFSPDGRSIAAACHDRMIHVWDARTGAPLHVLRGHTGYGYALTVSADGRRLVSGDQHGTIKVWDLESGIAVLALRQTGNVADIAFSPDGRWFACGGNDDTVKIWDAGR